MQLHSALTEDEYTEIPGVLVNGWSGSWKKYLFSLMYHNDWYLLYPGYKQVSMYRILECWKISGNIEGFLYIWACLVEGRGFWPRGLDFSWPEVQRGFASLDQRYGESDRYYLPSQKYSRQEARAVLEGGEGGAGSPQVD